MLAAIDLDTRILWRDNDALALPEAGVFNLLKFGGDSVEKGLLRVIHVIVADLKPLLVLGLNQANIVDAGKNYLYAEFTSTIMGYVDDVEFLYDAASSVTHVRSASRLGYSDMGANRKRIEAIRNALSSN